MIQEFFSTLGAKIGAGIVGLALFITGMFGLNANLGSEIPQSVASFSTTLATEINSTATSFTLTSGTTDDGTTLSGFYGFVIDSGTSSEEFVTATCTDTACTSATRGISVVTGDTTISTLKYTHRKGASVKISDHPVLTVLSRMANGDESFPNSLAITGGITTGDIAIFGGKATYTNTETINDDKDLTSKAYVDAAVVSGAPDASTTAKGVSEEATDAELAAGTATGGTGARLFAGGASHNETPAANKVCVANSSGMLNDGWLGLTTNGDMAYSDGTDFARLAIGTSGYYLTSNGSVPSWGGANLAEANTAFGSTDISGAELEDLSDGGASTAHYHNNANGAETLSWATDVTTDTIAHGLGATPKKISFVFYGEGESRSFCEWNGSGQSALDTNAPNGPNASGPDMSVSTGDCGTIHEIGSNRDITITVTANATNITFTIVPNDTWAASAHVVWSAEL